MSRRIRVYALFALVLVMAIAVGAIAALHPLSTHASPATESAADFKGKSDNLHSPQGDKQSALRQKALQDKAQGKASGKVYEVAKGQYVELDREGEDPIFAITGEFGDQSYTGRGNPGDVGPLHNQIPQPDRANDNTTVWTSNFDKAHYEQLIFSDAPGVNSMRNFYKDVSSNRFTVYGEVSDWVKVPYNEARYGSNYCGDIVCASVWVFIQDEANAWYNDQLAAGKTPDQINAYLAKFDIRDRYDYNGNGNFNEPDGYIDHFQSYHAGEGEETGGGAQGADAIWSHRWFAFYNLIGSAGPAFNKYGGIRIGQSNYWIGDYTMEPENAGAGVISHEFGHDLGLPDEYDTAGNTCGSACENSTGWWTLMSQGSYGTDGTQDLGTRPIHMSDWDKFQLGWLNYAVAFAGQHSEYKLGPAETNTKQAQGLFVVLPDKQVTSNLGAPYAGGKFYYSGTGDNLDTRMTKAAAVTAGATVTAKVRYNIEQDWDYAYLVVSTDGGATWTNVNTNLSTSTSPNGQNFGEGITGVSTSGGWVDLSATLPVSGNILLGFRYWTDGAQQGTPGAPYAPGFSVDELSVAGGPSDGAEADAGWTFSPASGGFHATTGTESRSYFNAYLAEYRQYRGYDDSLKNGPYNFGFLDNPNKQNYVEHFPYQDGLLIWYWDTSQGDDNTSAHPGEGLILPIDSHPAPLIRPDGKPWRPRVQSYDSPFTLEPTDAITLHQNSVAKSYPSLPGVSVFDDRNDYWNPTIPTASVKVPHTGTRISIQSVSAQDGFMQVQVN